MCYLVIVDHNDMAVHLTRSDREVLNIECNRWENDAMLWNGSERGWVC